MPSEVRKAVEAQQADRTHDSGPKIREMIDLINAELPKTLVEMKKHGFQEFRNKLYSASFVKVNGIEQDIWSYRSGETYVASNKATGHLRPQGIPEVGIMFVTSRSGEAVRAVVVGSPDGSFNSFTVYKKADLEALAKKRVDRLNALYWCLRGLQQEPKKATWDVGEAPPRPPKPAPVQATLSSVPAWQRGAQHQHH